MHMTETEVNDLFVTRLPTLRKEARECGATDRIRRMPSRMDSCWPSANCTDFKDASLSLPLATVFLALLRYMGTFEFGVIPVSSQSRHIPKRSK
jgi:hypothetical protein